MYIFGSFDFHLNFNIIPFNVRRITVWAVYILVIKVALTHMQDKEVIWIHPRFTKGRSSLNNLVVLYDEVTSYVDKERATDLNYQDYYKACNLVQHRILISTLKRYGFEEFTI